MELLDINAELKNSSEQISEEQLERFIEAVDSHKRIFVYGTGRSGLMLKALAMRLMQIGRRSYVVGETTTSSVGSKDLLIVASALTDRMKDSIVIHICAALLRGRKDNSQISVIVSCPGSMATSKYLEAQIKNYFNFHIAGTMTARQVEEAQDSIDDVDFIISTVPIQKSCLPVIVVNPLITVETINQIQNMVSRQNKNCLSGSITDSRERFPILGRIFSIYESGNKQKIDYLNRELKQILDDSFYLESRLGTSFVLLDMLKWKYIKIAEGRLNWRRAMEIAAEDLIRDGYFDERYVQEAIGNVEEYGNYIIINKGIALAHASKEAGVYEDGISLLVCREGIIFDEGDTVYLLFFFAQKKETDYLNLFKEIIKLGKKQEYIDKICGLSDANEIYRTMWEILSENEHTETALR